MDSELEYYQAAQVHLDTAIDLYYEQNWLCALTLAGAAEEVLGGILKYSLDKVSIHKDLIKVCLEYNPNLTESEISTILTLPRNMLKHFKAIDGLNLKPVDDSTIYIFKALENYLRLRGAATEKMQRFKNDEEVQKIIMDYLNNLENLSTKKIINAGK